MILLLSDVYSRNKAYFPQNSDRFHKMLFNPFLRAEPNDFSFPSFQRAGSAHTVKKKGKLVCDEESAFSNNYSPCKSIHK